MTTVRVADDGGDEMRVFEYNGYRYPDFPGNHIVNLASAEIRQDDIIVCAFPKSGTHWVWSLTTMLLNDNIDILETGKTACMLDWKAESEYKNLPSPRLLNSHVLYKNLPDQVPIKKPKIIHVLRNPKDVLVSGYPFMTSLPHANYTGKWENFFRPMVMGKFSYGSWFDYVLHWERAKRETECPVITLFYEDLLENPVRETKRLCEFLQLDRSEDFIKSVCDECSFKKVKEKRANKLDSFVYRKGQVGDWKNWFTVAQNEWYDAFYLEKMKDCSLSFRYTD